MLNRLLVTGAAGGIGRLLSGRLKGVAEFLRLSDIQPLDAVGDGEEFRICDLAEFDAVRELVRDCDGILHLGGKSVEGTFDEILQSNLIGLYNVYEAARQEGVSRILFPSSNHAIGFHTRETRLDANAPLRPDSLYGASKCFGEAIARLYYDKFGIESAVVRIGSCFAEPRDHRMLATWLSPDDFIRLIERVFLAPRLGCPVIYGVSANDECWWDNSGTEYLGWRPRDNAEPFRAQLDARMSQPSADDPAIRFQGGIFAAMGHLEDGVAK